MSDMVQSLLHGWAAILGVLAALGGAYWLGRRDGREAQARRHVQSVVDVMVAETVPILVPSQRKPD